MMNATDHYEAIASEYYKPLFRFAMGLTREESDSWDLTQQTFYAWATKGHQLRNLGRAKSWLFTTLYRFFLAARRRQNRFGFHTLDSVSDQLPALSPEFEVQADSSQLLSALGRVDDVYQAAVTLFYLEECSYGEIAEILEIPVGTVKSRIARGIMQLRKLLGSAASETHLDPGSRDEMKFPFVETASPR